MCGGASICTEEPASDDADLLYRIADGEAHKRDNYANFHRYYVLFDEQERNAA